MLLNWLEICTGPDVLACPIISSSARLFCRRLTRKSSAAAECSWWWVDAAAPLSCLCWMTRNTDLNLLPGRGCMYVRVCGIYIHQSCPIRRWRLPPAGAGLISSLDFSRRPRGAPSEVQLHGDTFNWINRLQFLHFTCRNPGVTPEQPAGTPNRCWCSGGLWSQRLQLSLPLWSSLSYGRWHQEPLPSSTPFLTYVQAPDLLLRLLPSGECFPKRCSARVRHVMLGLTHVCFCVFGACRRTEDTQNVLITPVDRGPAAVQPSSLRKGAVILKETPRVTQVSLHRRSSAPKSDLKVAS